MILFGSTFPQWKKSGGKFRRRQAQRAGQFSGEGEVHEEHILEARVSTPMTSIPIPSMYGIFTYIWLFLKVKYGKCR